MTDSLAIDAELPLVERLHARSRAVFLAAEAGPAHDLSNHLKEAAAEIDRLRKALESLADNPFCDPDAVAEFARKALAGDVGNAGSGS